MITPSDVENAYDDLTLARESGDQLSIDLAESALNDLLQRFFKQSQRLQLSHVTTEE